MVTISWKENVNWRHWGLTDNQMGIYFSPSWRCFQIFVIHLLWQRFTPFFCFLFYAIWWKKMNYLTIMFCIKFLLIKILLIHFFLFLFYLLHFLIWRGFHNYFFLVTWLYNLLLFDLVIWSLGFEIFIEFDLFIWFLILRNADTHYKIF